VRQDAARDDPHVRAAIRPHRGVAALGDRPIGDVGVRADQVVRLEVAEEQRAVPPEAGPNVDIGRSPANCLERLLEREDEANRPSRGAGHEREQRLVFRVLFAAECAPRVGRVDADLGER
jgi:hypothetical protein